MNSPRPARLVAGLGVGLVLLVALLLRAHQVEWGLPGYFVPDERVFSSEVAARMASRPLAPTDFFYPHLQLRTIDGLHRLLGALGAVGPGAAESVRLGRWLNVWLGVATVAMTFSIGRRFFGHGPALAGAAFLAVAPAAVSNAHINGTDGPLTFWMTLSLLLAAIGFQSARGRWCVAAGFVAGLAAAVKYPGFAAILPALLGSLWCGPPSGGAEKPGASRLALRRPVDVLALTAAVGVACATGFVVGCPSCASAWQVCLDGMQIMSDVSYRYGATAPIPTEGWLAHKWWFQLVAVLPYCLGVAACASAYLGLSLMVRRRPSAFLFLGSLVVPYFLVMGGSGAAYPRYYLPVLPPLCLAAGFLWLPGRKGAPSAWRHAGRALVVVGLVQCSVVSVQTARGFHEGTRLAAARALLQRVERRSVDPGARPRATIGVFRILSGHDGLAPHLHSSDAVRVSEIRTQPDWMRDRGPDYLVLSLPSLVRARRATDEQGGAFWRALLDGQLGYDQVETLEPRPIVLGGALDALLVHAWTNGDIGFAIYERRARRPAGARSAPEG